MPIFSRENKNILFLHIPKSAGSSVEMIARDLGWTESFSNRGKSLMELSHYKSSLQHLHAYPLENIFNLNEFDAIFTIVREPFSRLKSEYYWQKSQGITNLNVDDWIRDTFEKYRENNYIYDNHIRPQVDFIPSQTSLSIFKLEQEGVRKSKELMMSLNYEYGFKAPLSYKVNSILSFFSFSMKEQKKSTKDPVVENRFDFYYDEIFDFYKKDYVELSYS